ncbi:ketodeoxygluconokinase [Photobacterium aphoticum]|uniref:2-dehydro-3-deoxygluconokinase n=2 Tax=Photobacterium aphoticum TaxID=754436 RepID=A0A0J1GIS2_9GAMM|nr:ketodeoxygluconokinase [Photobacterium aphoticum]
MIELSGKPFSGQEQRFGGDTLNTALYLSRLVPGLAPSYVTALGEDTYSQHMLKAWQDEGIDTALTVQIPGKLPGMYAIELDEQGERTFHYWRGESAAKALCQQAQFSTIMATLQSYDLVYLTGISLAIFSDEDKHAFLLALESLKASGVKIAVDSNYRPRLWPNAADACEWLGKLYQLSDIALVTAEDEDAMLGMQDSPASIIATRLHSMGVKQVVVKLGSEGAMWSEKGQSGQARTNKVDHVVDTTAAGDSFNAGYLAAWSMGMTMAECCHWGNKLASRVIQHQGAIIPRDQTHYITELMSI